MPLFLSNYASINIQDSLSRIKGVGSVSQFGPLDYGMRVWLDPDRLTSLNLTTADVANAISNQNVQATAGQLGAPPFDTTSQFQLTIQAKGRLKTVEEFGDIVLRANADGSFIRLKDVARIELGSQNYGSTTTLNNSPAAGIGIYQSPGANALEVANKIYAELERLEKRFPPDVEYNIVYDTTLSVRASVQEVVTTLFMTFALVVAVTFLFLADWRSTLIPTLAIPVSLIGTFAFLYLFGFSINTITLFAIILAIGVVVDDSIVVVENVQRVMDEEGLDVREATRKSMEQVTGPVIATTLVLLAVFVPVSLHAWHLGCALPAVCDHDQRSGLYFIAERPHTCPCAVRADPETGQFPSQPGRSVTSHPPSTGCVNVSEQPPAPWSAVSSCR